MEEQQPLRYAVKITDADYVTRSYVILVHPIRTHFVGTVLRRRRELFTTEWALTPGAVVGHAMRRIIDNDWSVEEQPHG